MSGKSLPSGAKRGTPKTAKPKKATAGRSAAKSAAKKTSPAAGGAKAGPIALRNVAKRTPAGKNSHTFYIFVDYEELRISTEKPTSTAHVMTAGTFDEAKEKAVDYLIELIDTLERRLWQIKQSSDLDSLIKKR